MITESLYELIDNGRKGKNTGISTGLPKLDELTYGIQKGWMTIVGGDSGSGKSSFVLYSAIYNSFSRYLESLGTDDEFDVSYLIFSFEMSAEVLFAKLLSTHIYNKYGVIISYSDILSFGEPLSEEYFNLLNNEIEWIKIFESKCLIYDKPCTAKQLYGICKSWAEKLGDFTELENGTELYKENNSNLLPIVVVDHIKLLKLNTGHTAKQEIDEACDYLIWFRNKCKFSIYVVQQLNRNFKQYERRKDESLFNIGLEDFSDSSGTIQAAEIVLAIYNPEREKRSRYMDYDIKTGLQDRARSVSVLKHRFGIADRLIAVGFYGEVSLWKELPPANIINYEAYRNL